MSAATPAIRELARRLIAIEAALDSPPVAGVRVCDKVRLPLTKLAGVDGFRSLMSRAVAMAKSEAPSLDGIQVLPDGSLEDVEAMGQNEDGAGVVVVGQLLGLLVTFIGEPLTMRLLRDAWPDVLPPGVDEPRGGGP